MTSPIFLDDRGELLVVAEKPKEYALLHTAALSVPFLGWFLGLKPALQGEGFWPYGWTWGLTAPFFGWFVALYLLYVWDGP